MIKIEINNMCSCAKKRKAWTKELNFETVEEACEVAQKMCVQGNEKFCKKHSFEYEVKEDKVVINTLPKNK